MIDLFRVRSNKDEALRLVGECLDRGYTGQGVLVDRFEEELAKLLDWPRDGVLMVNSGTSALQLALALCGVDPQHPGGEVILPPVTCTADAHAVLSMGGKIVWADVDPRTGLMDARDASLKVNENTRAVMPTDWGGTLAEVAWGALGVPIIEDAAHRLTGPHPGDFVALSCQSIKHLSCGDGGALLVRDPAKAEEGRLRRWFSLDRRSNADFRCSQDAMYAGYKMQATDLDASFALANLPLALDSVEASRENARWYQANLPAEVLIPWQEDSPYWLYTILVEGRDGSGMPMDDSFKDFMAQNGIAVSPVHARVDKHTAFREYRRSLPGVDWFTARHCAIPNGFWVTPEDREKVAAAVERWVRR